MLGLLFVGISLVIVFFVLYGHKSREQFTNIKGSFPKWVDILQHVRKILDSQFDYDAVKFSELADKQEISQLKIQGDDIQTFMTSPESKKLPKAFQLNVDLPFDSQMAIFFAQSRYYQDILRKPEGDVSKLVNAYQKFYEVRAEALRTKEIVIARVIKYCFENKIIADLKKTYTFSI